MAKTEGRRTYNTFVQGIITEATGINYPENASIDEENFVLNRNGSRQRRLGFDLEVGGTEWGSSGDLTTTTSGLLDGAAGGYQTAALASYLWANTGPGAQINLTVVQYGSRLYFFNTDSDAVSGASVSFTTVTEAGTAYGSAKNWYDLTKHTTGTYTGSDFETYKCDFSRIKGSLIVVGKHIEPFYLKIGDDGTFFSDDTDDAIDSLEGVTITIEIRDFEGVVSTESGTAITFDDRPTTLDRSHEYNLKNQGWDRYCDITGGRDNPLKGVGESFWDAAGNVYPANSDSIHPGFQFYQTRRIWKHKYWEDSADSINTLVPGGNYILNAFTKDRDGLTPEVTYLSAGTIGTEIEQNRPNVVTSFSGRIWYTGINSNIVETDGTYAATKGDPNYTKIFFTQSITTLDRIGRCYQKNNPTSEELNAIISTDGGVIDISEAGQIVGMRGTKNSLFVFGTEGVWEITGQGDQAGFTADSYKINKITDVGALGRDSIVSAEGSIFFWSVGGIYVMMMDEFGQWGAQNITESTIQTLYVAINKTAREQAVGFYDAIKKRVRWMYDGDGTILKDKDKYQFTNELVFDIPLKAFYKYSIGASTWFPAAYSPVLGQRDTLDDVDVVAQGHQVIVADGREVGATITVSDSRGANTTKYLIVKKQTGTGQRISFAEYRNTTFVDWSFTGTDVAYSSYLVTGYELFGDPSISKQAKNLHMFFNKTEDGFTGSDGDFAYASESGCYVRARWDWSDSGNSGKWGSKFQAYRFSRFYVPSGNSDTFENGLPVVHTKNLIRGSGNALSLYIESEAGKDMYLLGWTIDAEGRTVS